MAVSDISLTAGMKNNLLSLQNTSSLINRTQERLSSGKRVNTALDNPTNYFAAQGHMERANDLSVRKDGMAEAVQAVKAADAGIRAISGLIESAKGIAAAALATSSSTDRGTFATTFNTLRTQIDQLASDSGYRGTNLLGGNTLTVQFGAKTDAASLDITGFNASTGGALAITEAGTTVGSGWAQAGDAGKAAINASSKLLETALEKLRTESSKLSSNLSVVTARQDFTNNMINTLQVGADGLTLADTNEEGANMLMLQTRQNLGITSLSMASQAAQAVLRLF